MTISESGPSRLLLAVAAILLLAGDAQAAATITGAGATFPCPV